MISIKPKWCEKIVSGEKTIEVRKTAPKEVPFKCYIYMTQGTYKVIGEFICDKVIRTCGWRLRGDTQQCAKRTVAETELPKLACLTIDEIVDYAGSENREVVGWHISDLKIYDKPKELREFKPICKFDGKDAICALFCPNWKYDGGLFFECTRKVTRPPQSWQYVEELCKAQN